MESGLSKAHVTHSIRFHQRDLADVMRATRSAGYDVFIRACTGGGLHAAARYELVGATHKSEQYLLIGTPQVENTVP